MTVDTPEMKKIWEEIGPYVDLNNKETRMKTGTPKRIFALREEYRRLAREQEAFELSLM